MAYLDCVQLLISNIYNNSQLAEEKKMANENNNKINNNSNLDEERKQIEICTKLSS